MTDNIKDEIRKFIDKLKDDDFNVIDNWDYSKFKIICQDCGSDDTIVFYRGEEGCFGSEYTGYMRGFIHDNGLVVKCKNCGLAIAINNLE